jgi:N6-L-threonylcarbamoyladenine synthase
LKKLGEVSEETKSDIARAFEDAAIEVLMSKTREALKQFDEARTLIVGGGVSANAHLRKEVESLKSGFPHLDIRLPEKSLTTDNAVMIGIAAYINIEGGVKQQDAAIEAHGNLALTRS